MSTNCIRCGPPAKRTGVDMLCDTCRFETHREFEGRVEKIEAQYPPVHNFLDTWGANCGASRKTFAGHTVKMLEGVLTQAAARMEEVAAAPTKAIELLFALAPGLEEDVLLALRFLYYVKAAPVVPDNLYTEAEEQFINRPEVDDSPLMQPGSDKKADYPEHVIALAFFLETCGWKLGQKAGKAVASAKPSPVSAPGGKKTAQEAPEVTTATLF